MSRYSRKFTLWCKSESVYGTDSVPTSSNGIRCFDPKLKLNGKKLEIKELHATLSRRGFVPGVKDIELEFKTYGKGYGTGAAPKVGPLIKAASWDEALNISAGTCTYTPSSSGTPSSCTIYANLDGILVKMVGCRTDFKFTDEAGEFEVIQWKAKALYTTPIDSPIDTSLPTEELPPVCKAMSVAVAGYSPSIKTFEIDWGNKLVGFNSLNATEAIEEIIIPEREPKGKYTIKAILEATETIIADWEAATIKDFTSTLGSVAGNKIVRTGQLQTDTPEHGDTDGILTYEQNFDVVMPDDDESGDNEMSIVYHV